MEAGKGRKGNCPPQKRRHSVFNFFLGFIYIPREKEEVIKYTELCKGNKPVSSKPWQSEKNCQHSTCMLSFSDTETDKGFLMSP